jgi:hypothetical protein
MSIPVSSAARSCIGPSPQSSVGGRQHRAGHEEGTVAITESDRISGHCTAGQLPADYAHEGCPVPVSSMARISAIGRGMSRHGYAGLGFGRGFDDLDEFAAAVAVLADQPHQFRAWVSPAPRCVVAATVMPRPRRTSRSPSPRRW